MPEHGVGIIVAGHQVDEGGHGRSDLSRLDHSGDPCQRNRSGRLFSRRMVLRQQGYQGQHRLGPTAIAQHSRRLPSQFAVLVFQQSKQGSDLITAATQQLAQPPSRMQPGPQRQAAITGYPLEQVSCIPVSKGELRPLPHPAISMAKQPLKLSIGPLSKAGPKELSHLGSRPVG